MTKIGPGLFRLFLAALVVLHHSFPLRLGTWAVYVFFILSGYWICRFVAPTIRAPRSTAPDFHRQPLVAAGSDFLLCTALNVGSGFLLNGGRALHRANDVVWWLRQLLIAGSNGAGTDLPPSWSLDVEMHFFGAAVGAIVILLLVDRPSERLREAWVASRRKKPETRKNYLAESDQFAGFRTGPRSKEQ